MTQEEAATKVGVSLSQYRKLERGERNLTAHYIDLAARAFGVTPAEVISDASAVGSVRVMGYVGAGAEILPEFEQVPEEGLRQIDLPFSVPEEIIGLEVRGDSMIPRYDDGDVILVWTEQRRPISSYIGEEVAVRTADGRRFLKQLIRDGVQFSLYSWNARPIHKVDIEWIGEIHSTIRATQFRRANVSGQLRRAS